MNRVVALMLCLAAVVGVQVVKNVATERSNVQPVQHQNPRTVYPYSVIAGGVQSGADVKAAMHDDAIVAAHYADINVAKLKVVKQVGDVRRYVSYRINGAVSWTSKPVTIKDGELLLTDGSKTLRGRCGNMLSDTPQQPTQALNLEPGVEELDKPLPLGYISQTTLAPAAGLAEDPISDPTSGAPNWTSYTAASNWTPNADESLPILPLQSTPPIPSISGASVPVQSAGSSAPSSSGGSLPFIPGIYGPPFILPTSQAGADGTPPNPATKGSGDVAATPEPSTVVMLGFGLAGMLLLKRTHASTSLPK